MISHFISSDGKNWDEVVPYALMAYRSAPHTATGYSPHLLLFGQEMRLPTSDDLAKKSEVDEAIQSELDMLKARLQQVRELAIVKSEKHKQKYKEQYDKKENFKPYQVGQFVYLHDATFKRGPHKQFAKVWKGPYEIIEVLNKINYKLNIKSDESIIVHYNRLKPSKTNTRKQPQRKSVIVVR